MTRHTIHRILFIAFATIIGLMGSTLFIRYVHSIEPSINIYFSLYLFITYWFSISGTIWLIKRIIVYKLTFGK